MTDHEILKKAIEVYGIEKQVDMAIEEMSELIKALLKYRRNPSLYAEQNILEETADVWIMLIQLELMFSSESGIQFYFNKKIERLKKQLESEDEI